MKKLFSLIKLSAKRSFKALQKSSPLSCGALSREIYVTKLFYHHISFSFKERGIRDRVERLLIIPLIQEILSDGRLTEVRAGKHITTYRISLSVGENQLEVIISKKKEKHYLLSCFKKTRTGTQKRDLSWPPMATRPQGSQISFWTKNTPLK